MYNRRSLYIIVLLLLGTVSLAKSQVPELINNEQFRPRAKAAVNSIYNFKFQEAEKELASWKRKYPDHPLWTLLEGMKFWWTVLSDLEDTSHDERFITMMKRADFEAEKLLHQQSMHADGLIIKAISNGYLARHFANRGDWLNSIQYGRVAMNAHEYLLEKQPDFADLKLAEGLKLYYSAYLPEAYPVVKTISWALPDGDKEKGLQMLKEASAQAIFASAEATYFLGNINFNYENNFPQALRYFRELSKKYPDNNYYVRLLVKTLFRMKYYGEAVDVIDSSFVRWEKYDLPHKKVLKEELLTWKGRILEKKGQESRALSYYKKAMEKSKKLPNTRSRVFYVTSTYLAGEILYHQGNHKEAKRYFEIVSKAEIESAYKKKADSFLSEM